MSVSRCPILAIQLLGVLAWPAVLAGQSSGPAPGPGPNDPALALPRIVVAAQKEPELAQNLPESVTALTAETVSDADLRAVGEGAVFAPNVRMAEFTARKLSNPYFRGIGSSPNNPGVTTYFDGVPQLNANSSSLTLLDAEQIEFVRGAASELFGRNTVGGLINVTSRPPGQSATGAFEVGLGSRGERETLLRCSGPVAGEELGGAFAGGYATREGYTRNSFTGHDLDGREAWFGKVQLLWRPLPAFSARLLVSGERDRDGDYALGDLAALRRNPWIVTHDFEGFTHRDVTAPTLRLEYRGQSVQLASITGGVWWKTADLTDLDYTAAPLMTRWNHESAHQLTQEVHFSSPKDSPLAVATNRMLSWQSGAFFFRQDYRQTAWNDLSPYVAQTPFPLRDQSEAALDDRGIGIYGQGRLSVGRDWDFTVASRFDRESKDADLRTFVVPAVAPDSAVKASRDFSAWSPSLAVARRVAPDVMLYASAARGFKAGGFNAIAPAANQAYGLERSWNYEFGLKAEWLNRRLRTNVALFHVDWDALQLNVPVLAAPGRFYIDNAGAARSRGAEIELTCRPARGWDVFGSAGCVDAKFAPGTQSGGLDVGGHKLPYAPDFTAHAGAQYSWQLNAGVRLFARAQLTVSGRFAYDASNAAGQGAYTVPDLRLGVDARSWFAEAGVSNATNTKYVPIALPYSTAFAPSGYVGESGAPAVVTFRGGRRF